MCWLNDAWPLNHQYFKCKIMIAMSDARHIAPGPFLWQIVNAVSYNPTLLAFSLHTVALCEVALDLSTLRGSCHLLIQLGGVGGQFLLNLSVYVLLSRKKICASSCFEP